MKKKDLEEAAGITHYQMYKLANDKDITTDPTTSMCTKRRGRAKAKPNDLSSTTSWYLDINPTQCHPNYTADIREGVAIEYVSCEPSDSLKELFSEGYNANDDFFEEAENGAGVTPLRI